MSVCSTESEDSSQCAPIVPQELEEDKLEECSMGSWDDATLAKARKNNMLVKKGHPKCYGKLGRADKLDIRQQAGYGENDNTVPNFGEYDEYEQEQVKFAVPFSLNPDEGGTCTDSWFIAEGGNDETEEIVPVPRYDANKLAVALRQKGTPAGSSQFNWTNLGYQVGVCFNSLPSNVSFLNGPLETVASSPNVPEDERRGQSSADEPCEPESGVDDEPEKGKHKLAMEAERTKKKRRIVIDNDATELTSNHIKNMLRDTSDIVLQNVPRLAEWDGEKEEANGYDGICPALQKLPAERLLARPCIGDDGGLAPELLALWGRNTRRITGKAGTGLPFRMRGRRGAEQRAAAKKLVEEEAEKDGPESADMSGVDMEEDIVFGGGGDIDFGEEGAKDSGKSNRDDASIDTTNELNRHSLEVIHNINNCTLTDIKPSPIGLDGVGVYAATQITKGAVIFETPRGCAEPEYVGLTGEQVMALVTNPVALNAIEKRFPPELEDGDPRHFIFWIPLSGPNGLSIPDFINHASSKRVSHNVRYGRGEDAHGNQMLETVRDVEKGEELIIEHDVVMDERFKRGKAFVKSILSGSRAVVAARRRADAVRDGMDEDALELVDNLNNNVCLQLGPSNVHGVGLIVGDGGSNLVEAGVDPLQLPAGCRNYETIDVTQAQLEKLVTDPHALSKIRRHCAASLTPIGEWVLALPAAGFNAMDISHYLNSAEGTGEKPHVFTVCDQIDQRGLNPMVIEAGVEVADGDEILADYKLAPDLNDWDGVLVEQSAKEVDRDDDQTYIGNDDDDGDDNDDELSFKTDGDVSQAGSEDSKAVAGLSIETAESNLEEMARLGDPARFELAGGIPQTFYMVAREAKEALASLTEEERKKRMFYNTNPGKEFLLLEWDGGGIRGGQLPDDATVLAFCSSVNTGSDSLRATLRCKITPLLKIPPQGRRIGSVLVVPFREETMGKKDALEFDTTRLAELLKENGEVAAYRVDEELDGGAKKHIGVCGSRQVLSIACNIAQISFSPKLGKYPKAKELHKRLEENNLLMIGSGNQKKTWKTEDSSLRKKLKWVVEDDSDRKRTFWISATLIQYSSLGRTKAGVIAAAEEQQAIDKSAEKKRVLAMKIIPKKDRKKHGKNKCCKVKGCIKSERVKGLCVAHKSLFEKHGRRLDE